jgi:hypothetical protein
VLKLASVSVVDEDAWLIQEAKAFMESDAIVGELRAAAGDFGRVGLESGPLSKWRLFFGLNDATIGCLYLATVSMRRPEAAMGHRF